MVGNTAAASQTCPDRFLDGRPPALANPKLAERTVPLCFSAFAILYSGTARTPLYAAERLTRQGVGAARKVDRVDAFHDEDELPESWRSRLEDYVHSGFDRGHMAPAGDMPTAEAQAESFSLANVVPQDRSVNRSLWAAIEESVRRLAIERGTLFVVTGPVFAGTGIQAIKGRVLVPTELFKAVYDPKRGEGAAYLVPNRPDGEWRKVALGELQAIAGLDPFPGLSPQVKARAMDLPEPRVHARDRPDPWTHPGAAFDAWLRRSIETMLRRLWRGVIRAIF